MSSSQLQSHSMPIKHQAQQQTLQSSLPLSSTMTDNAQFCRPCFAVHHLTTECPGTISEIRAPLISSCEANFPFILDHPRLPLHNPYCYRSLPKTGNLTANTLLSAPAAKRPSMLQRATNMATLDPNGHPPNVLVLNMAQNDSSNMHHAQGVALSLYQQRSSDKKGQTRLRNYKLRYRPLPDVVL